MPTKPKPVASPNHRRRIVLACAVLSATFALLLAIRYGLERNRTPIPNPDRSEMEPQVAARIDEARKAVERVRDSHEAWGQLGVVLHAHSLEKEAAICYRHSAALAPSEFRWPYLLAHALRDSDPSAALSAAGIAERLKPDYSPVYVLRGRLLEAAGDSELALEEFRKAAELDPSSAAAEFGLGRLYLGKGERDEALRHLVKARDSSEDVGAIHGALAQVYQRLGDREAALRENRLASQSTETIPIRDPVHYAMRRESVASTALLERAREADRAGDLERAETLYSELVRFRPDDAYIRSRFGDLLARQSKLGPAREQYEAALKANPQDGSAHHGLANVFNFEGDYESAERHYRAALETRPDHAPTLVNLASLLSFHGKTGEALALLRQAAKIDPRGFATNRELGRVLFQLGKYSEAVPHLRTAVGAHPDAGPMHLQLGMALAATGNYREARIEVEKARELGQTVPQELLAELRRRTSS